MFNEKDITVLIATKDRVEEIQRGIQSSLDQTIKANIVVLDCLLYTSPSPRD